MSNVQEELELELAQRVGRKYCLLTSSGTAALTVTLKGLLLPKGSAIMVSPLTCYAVLLAILFAELKPVFVDVDFPSLTINRESAQNALKRNAKGIIAIHHFGQPEDMEFFSELGSSNGIFLIEDFAAAFGGKIREKMMGSFGDASITSFGPEKILDCGGGGAVFTDSKEILSECLRIREVLPRSDLHLKRAYATRYLRSYNLLKAGFKLGVPKPIMARTLARRMKNFALMKISEQVSVRIGERLPDLEKELDRRYQNASVLKCRLSHPLFYHSQLDATQGTCFRYSVLVPESMRLGLLAELQKDAIFASTLYYPNLAQLYGYSNAPKANEISSRIVNFIIDMSKGESDMETLAQKANSAMEKLSARKISA